jgi:transcription elongation regulator 1
LPTFPANAPQKEKPKLKTPIPGTDWLRVTTNQGNVFFTNKAKKESLWTVPDEIKDAVELLEKQEEEDKARAGRQAQEETRNDVEAEQEREIERVRMEVQEVVKRKAEDISRSDETVVSKKPRVEDQVGDEAEEADGLEDSEDSDVEDWQREAAAQLAKEAEEEKIRQEEEEAEEARKAKESAPQLTIPDRVDLSLDEGKALFKVCLQCDISLVSLGLSHIACTDLTPGERRQPVTSMGYVPSAFHLRPTLCAPSFRFCASRSLRRVLSRTCTRTSSVAY